MSDLLVRVDPAKVQAAIAGLEEELAQARAEHDEKASEADEAWRQVLDLERRLKFLQDRLAARAITKEDTHNDQR